MSRRPRFCVFHPLALLIGLFCQPLSVRVSSRRVFRALCRIRISHVNGFSQSERSPVGPNLEFWGVRTPAHQCAHQSVHRTTQDPSEKFCLYLKLQGQSKTHRKKRTRPLCDPSSQKLVNRNTLGIKHGLSCLLIKKVDYEVAEMLSTIFLSWTLHGYEFVCIVQSTLG